MTTLAAIQAPKTTKHLDMVRGILRGDVEPPPVAKLVGFDIVSIDVGRAVFELEAGPRHANPMGLFTVASCAIPPTRRSGSRWRRLWKTTSRSRRST